MNILRTLTIVYITAAAAFVASGQAERLLNRSMTERIVTNHRLAVDPTDPATAGVVAADRPETLHGGQQVVDGGEWIVELLQSCEDLVREQAPLVEIADFVIGWNERLERLLYQGTVVLRDQHLHQVHTESADGTARDYFLDRETFLVRAVAVKSPDNEAVQVKFFDQYRRIQGLMVPVQPVPASDDERLELNSILLRDSDLSARSNVWGAHLIPGHYVW